MKLSELKDAVTGIDGRLTEAQTEIVDLIKRLEQQIADAEVPQEIADTVQAIRARVDTLADIVQ